MRRTAAALAAAVAAIAVFAIALSVRLFLLADLADCPSFSAPIVDAAGYDRIARRWLSGVPMPPEFFWQPLFYPVFLSGAYAATGGSILAAKAIQAVLGAATCALTTALGCRLFGRRTGWIAGLLTAFCAPLLLQEADLVGEGWAAFWFVAIVALVLAAQRRATPFLAFALGAAGALGTLTRPNLLLVFAAAIAGLVGGGPRPAATAAGGIPLRTPLRGRAILACLAGFCLLALPAALLNRHRTGHFTIFPASAGINLFIGNHPQFDASAVRPGPPWERLADRPVILEGRPMDMWERDAYFRRAAAANLRQHPAAIVRRVALKTFQLVSSRELPGDTDPYLFREWSILMRVLLWRAGRFGFPMGVLLPLAAAGLVIGSRRREARWLALLVALYALPLVLTHVKTRYRAPMAPALCLLAAAGAGAVAGATRQRDGRAVAGACLAALPVFLLGTAPGPFAAENADYRAEYHLGVSSSRLSQGDRAGAWQSLRRAIELGGDTAETQYRTGTLLQEEGRLDDAARCLDQSRASDPSDARPWHNLAVLRHAQGRVDEAEKLYREAIRLRPDLAPAHANLAGLLDATGRRDEALAELRAAAHWAPDDAITHRNLGLLSARQGRTTEALAELRLATQLKPDDAIARCLLALALEQAGDKTAALRQFSEALRVEPANPTAADGVRRLSPRAGPPTAP